MIFGISLPALLLYVALPVLPVIVPLLCGSLLLLIPGRAGRMGVAVVGSSLTLLASLLIAWATFSGEVLVSQVAGWPAPYGISLVADGLSGLMLLLSGLITLLGVVYLGSSFQHAPRPGRSPTLGWAREAFGAQALLQFLQMGVNMSFLTGDLFNLFVAFEVMLIASYGLLLLGGEVAQLREGFRYVVMNLVASSVFVITAGFAYGLFGTLNLADIANRVAEAGSDPRVSLIAALLALVFGFKAALFPIGFWLPSAYPAPPIVLGAVFSALLTKVGVYALIRILTLLFPGDVGVRQVLLALAALTMLFGAFGMLNARRWRHAFAFATVASVGYLVMGTAIGSQAGLAATLYYLPHSALLMFALFLLAGLAERIAGMSYRVPGHLALYPWIGAGVLVGVLALAGLPPTSGFVGKFGLLQAVLEPRTLPLNVVAGAAVLTSLLLLYGGLELWRGFFWGAADSRAPVSLPPLMRFTTGASVVLIVLLSVFADPLYRLTGTIAAQLHDPASYIDAVLPPPDLPLQRPPDSLRDAPAVDDRGDTADDNLDDDDTAADDPDATDGGLEPPDITSPDTESPDTESPDTESPEVDDTESPAPTSPDAESPAPTSLDTEDTDVDDTDPNDTADEALPQGPQ
ncbi:MAG: proton-conducting transporter membrane subunit [Trueperaceae bacterium]|nr:proton-conducting transporter membrane subunit [Trueperaceae bacterium]